jgi:hypothetical protein
MKIREPASTATITRREAVIGSVSCDAVTRDSCRRASAAEQR